MDKKIYDKQDLLNTLSNLTIEKSDDKIVTKFNGRTISTVKVSEKYEIFNFNAYVNHILPIIEQNFKINKYELTLRGGLQFLRLYSDDVTRSISGTSEKFSKTFNIVSSSDKSRALSFNLGLFIKSSNTHIIGLNETKTYKKHLIGITEHVDSFDDRIKSNIFDEQISLITQLSGHKISLKDICEVIYTGDVKSNWDRFLAFKRVLLGKFDWSDIERNILVNKDPNIKYDNTVQIDAYQAFITYMCLYNREDSYIISKETNRFLEIRNVIKRNNKLSLILNS